MARRRGPRTNTNFPSNTSQTTALRIRDTVVQLARVEIERSRPDYRYAVVISIDTARGRCTVRYQGDSSHIVVKMGTIQPTAVGDVVRVGGRRSDRHVTEVLNNRTLKVTNIDINGDLSLEGGTISANYVPATSGFLLDGSDGTAEFNNITMRGDLTSSNYVANSAGYFLDYSTGSAEFNDITMRGDLTSSNYVANSAGYFLDSSAGTAEFNGALDVNGLSTFNGAMEVNGTSQLDGSVTVNGTLRLPDGTSSVPSFAFINDTAMGMYRVGNAVMGLTAQGVDIMHLSSIGTNSLVPYYTVFASASFPSYSFAGDANTGMYRYASDQIGFSTGGVLRARIASDGIHLATTDWFRTYGTAGWYNGTYSVGLYATQASWVTTYPGGSGLIAQSTVLLGAPLSTATTSGSYYIRRESTFGTLQIYTSTRDLKENVKTIDPVEAGRIIDKLRPVTYIEKYRSGPDNSFVVGVPDSSNETAEELKLRKWDMEYGFIAEELDYLEETDGIKLTTYDWQQIDEDDRPKPSGWKDSNVVALLVTEVQELRKRLAVLE